MTAFESILWTQGFRFNLLQPELSLSLATDLMEDFIPVMSVANVIPKNVLNTWRAGLCMSVSCLWVVSLIYLCCGCLPNSDFLLMFI